MIGPPFMVPSTLLGTHGAKRTCPTKLAEPEGPDKRRRIEPGRAGMKIIVLIVYFLEGKYINKFMKKSAKLTKLFQTFFNI